MDPTQHPDLCPPEDRVFTVPFAGTVLFTSAVQLKNLMHKQKPRQGTEGHNNDHD